MCVCCVNILTNNDAFCSTDEEKRLIWLYESVAIFILSAVIYLFHHVPYMLATLACTTFLYTQLLGRVDFR